MSNVIDYQKLMHAAMCSVVKNALTVVAQSEHFYNVHIAISFLTHYKGVTLPEHVKNNYPQEITVILQHQFRSLQVFDNSASVVLSFRGKEETVVIPYQSIIKYIDVYQGFVLDFEQYTNSDIEEFDDCDHDIDDSNEDKSQKGNQDNIIFIDTFLKK
ncbi:stringent starvation B family protein [Ehrlichia chaffeensis str. Heartland]|uniref:Stringent starvation protein B n=1 Tax=Ehrlichia chaffeensis (strain ATCC CRL-10679 / Arkansas) TaxID=205920 RepID=Q2GG90_EHRCR|nr:ClpXP protease specificity-enhancing factor SspB [Ehrlichia chaffeensis]ABD45560.1 conserved hypothetical protein [Ehrlichia chaffeensis str. Arkansas]AHX03808.1 stringent starvation B family protein [Ehrlichia chaffeensis str. Heartland]AHX05467.1 stringent starvation B family protein [Ehrlichia chaffeensis str. Jax]AHX06455.1 stringent starvation B family protein [Ehrlichia chaffeensis str. Liberty]AHX07131.1 stringent starvation B family protein [Ehrlichia chaffeensis str. Osceola]